MHRSVDQISRYEHYYRNPQFQAIMQNHTDLFNDTESSTSDPYSFLHQGYIEWYWVVLGLVVPVLLGVMFCVLDHMRRRKMKSTRHSEERLESMCERNKYAPPSYTEVAPQIVIHDIPVWNSALPSNINNPDITHSSNEPNTAAPGQAVEISVIPHNPAVMQQQETLSRSSEIKEDYRVTVHSVNGDEEVFDGTTNIPEPPSYNDYHMYELYGSQIHLV